MQVKTVTTVDVSADRSWSIIAEQFGDAADWASSLSSSRLDREQIEVGATRIGQLGKRELREEVTRLDRDGRVFAYELIDPPGPVRAATNTWTITEIGSDRSKIESEMSLSLHWLAIPFTLLIGFGLKRQIASAIEEFRTFAETGTPHERKTKS